MIIFCGNTHQAGQLLSYRSYFIKPVAMMFFFLWLVDAMSVDDYCELG
ncbi:hypothetical protein SALWKB12_0835 [Snodgrassella communis]|uniref:Uncharacterized protein n=1 Tax=Snodgrassella communis TaxID=2946699 RepID=A0A836MPW7_9NEIS|nr:hypothetical protein SALWKB12_0835 [Snodgrassella communis]KDN14060.1 hypothetical protein SALWKB29_1850 [Snodgrassella communis]